MGLGTLEKIGISLASAYVGSFFFPETFYAASGGLLGSAPEVATASALPQTAAQNAAFNAPALGLSTDSLLASSTLASAPGVAPGAAADPSFMSTLKEGIASPTALAGLLVAGSSLASTLLGQEEAEDNREFTSEEAQKARDSSILENEKGREFSAAQAALSRDHAAGLQSSSQEFQSEQAAKTKRFQAALSAQNARQTAFNNRANIFGRGGGRQLASNVANLNQAILS